MPTWSPENLFSSLTVGIMTFDESHQLFENAFHRVFPWEVIEVRKGPPNVEFSWRHWGNFKGHFHGNKGTFIKVFENKYPQSYISSYLRLQYVICKLHDKSKQSKVKIHMSYNYER